MSYHCIGIIVLLHGSKYYRYSMCVYTCIHKKFFIMDLLTVSALILNFLSNSLHAALFKSSKIQCQCLHSRCSPFARNQFRLKKNKIKILLTATLALKKYWFWRIPSSLLFFFFFNPLPNIYACFHFYTIAWITLKIMIFSVIQIH